jgi:diguanylate cyclase (GGDEF)-like protein/PAS domain S-box-containing protein
MPSESYSTYLRVSFLVIIFLVGMELAADFWRGYRNHQQIENIAEAYEGRIKLVHELHTLIRERTYTLNALLLEPDPFVVESLYSTFLDLGDAFNQTRRQLEEISLSGDGEEQMVVSELRKLDVRNVPVISHAIDVAHADVPMAEKRTVLAAILPYQRDMLLRSEDVLQYYLGKVVQQSDEAIAADRRWVQLTTILGAAIIVLIGLIGRNAIRRIGSRQRLLTTEIEVRKRLERNLEAQVEQRTQALQTRTEQLYEAQRVAQMGCWEWDLGSGEQRWTDELHVILDLDKAAPPSVEAFLEQVHPDDRRQVEEAIAEAQARGHEFDLDFRLLRADGSERVVQMRMVVETRDAQEKPVFLLGTLQDITERKRVEDQMRLAASVFAHTGDGVMITDARNRIVEINRAFSSILGYEMEDVVGRDPSLLKSDRHQRSFYLSMWQSLRDSGQWQGEVWDKRKSGDVIPLWMTINAVYDERGWVRHYVALFRDISEVKRTEQALWHIAHHDALTGLPNRNLMYDRLHMAMSDAARSDMQVALMLLDLDGFKQVNDELGHDAGDALLTHVGRILREGVRDSDTVARYAGDEFIVILKGAHDRQDVGVLARKLIDALMQPHTIKGSQVRVGASIGIALYPAHATGSEDLIAKADEAMYQAKHLGKNRHCFFGDECV